MKHARHQLAEILGERTLHLRDSSELAQEVAAYLLTENITAELESLMRDIMQYRMDHGIIEAIAISAHPLSKDVIKDIHDILKDEYPRAKSIIVSDKIDPGVIGGVKVQLANEQLDMTIETKLSTFKRLTALERNA